MAVRLHVSPLIVQGSEIVRDVPSIKFRCLESIGQKGEAIIVPIIDIKILILLDSANAPKDAALTPDICLPARQSLPA